MFSIVYFTMRPLSSVDDNLKRDEKLNNLISSLKCKGLAYFDVHSQAMFLGDSNVGDNVVLMTL